MSNNSNPLSSYCFFETIFNHRLKNYISSLTEYNKHLREVIKPGSTLPLFLDTSVLLRYYEASLNTRGKLKDYIEKNKQRIYITAYVQQEFVRRRESVINNFVNESLIKLTKDYKENVLGKLESFRNDITSFLDDFEEIGKLLDEIKEKSIAVNEELAKQIDDVRDKLKKLNTDDKYLELFLQVNLLEELLPEEVQMLKGHFDILKKEYNGDNDGKSKNKITTIFPGALDIKRKESNPYGDYLIFHEILKFIQEHKTDAIFLTYDTKGDWLNSNGEAYSHYIQAIYEGTGQRIFILDAKRYFDKVLKVDFAQLIEEAKPNSMPPNIILFNNRHVVRINEIYSKLTGSLRLVHLNSKQEGSLGLPIEDIVKNLKDKSYLSNEDVFRFAIIYLFKNEVMKNYNEIDSKVPEDSFLEFQKSANILSEKLSAILDTLDPYKYDDPRAVP